MIDQSKLWLIIIFVALFTFLLRLSFIGILGNHKLSDFWLRHLRYVAVAIIPGMTALMIYNPSLDSAVLQPSRLVAIIVGIVIGLWWKNPLVVMISCMLVFVSMKAFGV